MLLLDKIANKVITAPYTHSKVVRIQWIQLISIPNKLWSVSFITLNLSLLKKMRFVSENLLCLCFVGYSVQWKLLKNIVYLILLKSCFDGLLSGTVVLLTVGANGVSTCRSAPKRVLK